MKKSDIKNNSSQNANNDSNFLCCELANSLNTRIQFIEYIIKTFKADNCKSDF